MRLVVALVLIAVCPSSARSAPLTLEEVTDATATRFPLIVAAQEERAIAGAELYSAQGGFDPTVKVRLSGEPYGYYRYLHVDTWIEAPTPLWGTTFFAGYRLFDGQVPLYEGKLVTNTGGELRAGFVVPLLRNGPIDRRRASVERARIGKEVAELTIRQQLLESLRTASFRYWDWVGAGGRYRVQETILALATTRDAALRTRVQAGDLPAIERTDNERAIVQRQAALISARRALEQAAIELGLYLRGPDGKGRPPTPDRLPTDIAEPAALSQRQMEDDTRTALERRPEAARLMRQREQGDIELKWAKNQLWPGLDVTAQVSQDFGIDRPPARSLIELEGSILLDVPIPNRVALGRIRAAEAQLRRTNAQADFARDRIVADVRDAISAMTAARDRVAAARRELALARELERGERQKFDLGDSTLLFVNIREQATAEAALREVDALIDLHKAFASYAFATGTSR